MKWLANKKRLEVVQAALSVLAIVMAGTSLYIDVRQARQESGPNIQLVSLGGSLSVHRNKLTGSREVNLKAQIDLRNYGSAPASLVSISWDPIDPAGLFPTATAWLALADHSLELGEETEELHTHYRKEPLLGVQDTVFRPGKTRSLWLIALAQSQRAETVRLANIRVRLGFSNGQEIILVPDIKRFEFSESF